MVARYVPARVGGVVATYASVPQGATDPLQSLPICTNLCNNLGLAAPVRTVIAIAVLPWMRRLAPAHHAEMQGGQSGQAAPNATPGATSSRANCNEHSGLP